MDFSIYPDGGRYYAGSERKKSIVMPDGTHYMIKFQKSTTFGKRFNHVSEFLGSRIFQLAGLPAQEASLGTWQGEAVVACRDFITDGVQFVPFNEVGESTLEEDKEAYQYSYEDIMRMLHQNNKLTKVDETVDVFWRMYVVDALIGNFDRHGSNWGFLKEDGRYRIAPIFDNGSCLFPGLVDDDSLNEVLASREEMLRRVYEFPTSQIRLNDKKSSYCDVIASRAYPECNKALDYVLSHLNMENIFDLISEIDGITEIRAEFYRTILNLRYRLILRGESPSDEIMP